MTEEIKYQIFTEARGLYTIIKGKRMFQILFPYDAQIEENIEMINEIKKALDDAFEKMNKERENLIDGELKAEPID